MSKVMNIPFTLSKLGYKPDPDNPMRFLPPPEGHPYYPVTFCNEHRTVEDDCIKLMLQAAYEAGHEAT